MCVHMTYIYVYMYDRYTCIYVYISEHKVVTVIVICRVDLGQVVLFKVLSFALSAKYRLNLYLMLNTLEE